MHKEKLILVGNGMAGVRCVEEIIKQDPDRFSITIFGSEKHVNYNRILLSSALQGGISLDDIIIHALDWYQMNQIQLFLEETVIGIDIHNKTIFTNKKRSVPYDKLILATGSVPFILPLPGTDLEGVMTFRTIEDCQKIMSNVAGYKKAAVIGGGVLGLEAARGLLHLGMEVTIIHLSETIMERQLDQTAARLLQKELEKQEMSFLLEKETREFSGNGRVEKVIFKDGTEIDTDLVVMAVGVRPNVQLAKDSGIHLNRGIVVNDFMETKTSGIYAVGECAEYNGTVYGLVKPLYEQGRVLAQHICGKPCEGYKPSILSTKLKISGVDVFSAGQLHAGPFTRTLTTFDESDHRYKKLVFHHNKIVGAVLYGDTRESTRLLDMIEKKRDFSESEKIRLLEAGDEQESSVANLPQSSMICNCNEVTKRTIVEAVLQNGLTKVEEVKSCTKASSSCGGCKPLVEELISYTNSDAFNEEMEQETMCACTSLTDDEVVEQIQMHRLKSVEEIMDTLNWCNEEGCDTCRPALNYYLEMIYRESEDIEKSIYISETMNATRLQGGTYAITPQMYGGITNGQQLSRIATAVEKYGIANIVITDEQRMQITGIKKEDLADIWNDLNMPLTSLQKNSVRNVQIYSSVNDCLCEKEKHRIMAVSLEKQLEFLTTPYDVKIGVSSCIHNSMQSLTKGLGVSKIPRGWEIYAGGNEETQLKPGELLAVAAEEQEAFEIMCGFVQYYRENAKYWEPVRNWIDRTGLIHIREVLFDQELRNLLLTRMEEDSFKIRNRDKALEGFIQ